MRPDWDELLFVKYEQRQLWIGLFLFDWEQQLVEQANCEGQRGRDLETRVWKRFVFTKCTKNSYSPIN